MFETDRRSLLKMTFGSALGLMASRLVHADTPPDKAGKAKGKDLACIIVWLQGGPSQLDTFDPKPDHKNGGGIRTVKTRTPGLILASSLSGLAERSDKFLVVRSLQSTEGDHRRATYFVKTGKKPIAGIRHPAFGAAAAHAAVKAHGEAVLPPFLRIGGRNGLLEPDQGFLASDYAPFIVSGGGDALSDLRIPKGLTTARQKRRLALLEEIDQDFAKKSPEDFTKARRKALEKAAGFRGREELKAFDLTKESAKTRRRYGETGLGRSILLARRLVESGARCVEINSGGWDTHRNNAEVCGQRASELDNALSALLDDLVARDRLSSTLVVCMGEFGRTPRINRNDGRDHFPRAFSALLAGHNIGGGRVVGETSKDGESIVKNPFPIPDLFATCVHSLGLAPSAEFSVGDRPITLSKGKVRKELLKG